MRSRIAICVGGLAVVCLAPMAAAQTGDISRTPSGRPDLSGTYDVGTLTPMQRPTALGEKMFLTEEEAATFAARATAALDRRNNIVPSVNTEVSDPNRGAPPVGGDGSTGGSGNVGGYNTFWIEPWLRCVPDRRAVAHLHPHRPAERQVSATDPGADRRPARCHRRSEWWRGPSTSERRYRVLARGRFGCAGPVRQHGAAGVR